MAVSAPSKFNHRATAWPLWDKQCEWFIGTASTKTPKQWHQTQDIFSEATFTVSVAACQQIPSRGRATPGAMSHRRCRPTRPQSNRSLPCRGWSASRSRGDDSPITGASPRAAPAPATQNSADVGSHHRRGMLGGHGLVSLNDAIGTIRAESPGTANPLIDRFLPARYTGREALASSRLAVLSDRMSGKFSS